MLRLLVSTFRRLLDVTLTEQGTIKAMNAVSDSHGVYFGLTRLGPLFFAVERNADINEKPMTEGDPVDVIRAYLKLPNGRIYPTPLRYEDTSFYDLHEIAYDARSLFVTSSKYPFLLRKNLFGGSQAVEVSTAVPSHLKRHDDHTFDAYHINCASTQGKDLFVLAHNWDDPSFAMRLSLRKARQGRVVCKQTYENLGSCNHDIVPLGDVFWTLDSRGSALVRVGIRDDSRKRFLIESPRSSLAQGTDDAERIPFPRGLCALNDKLVVCYGFNEDRADRMDSEAMLAIFDLNTETFVSHTSLGFHGNTCAVLAV